MKIIKLTDSCYVQAQAILIIQEDLGLTTNAPVEIRKEWNGNKGEEEDYFMLMPVIKVVMIGERVQTLYFGSDQSRSIRLAELVEEWRGGECE